MGEKYNGWTNYETWNVALWMDNEQHTYNHWRSEARDVYRGSESSKHSTRAEVATRELAEMLKAEIVDNAPELSGCYSDILTAALGEVNWGEIAGHWIEEVKDEIDTDEREMDEVATTDDE